jgi:hypothetical protein
MSREQLAQIVADLGDRAAKSMDPDPDIRAGAAVLLALAGSLYLGPGQASKLMAAITPVIEDSLKSIRSRRN